jgi:hypothetical protein
MIKMTWTKKMNIIVSTQVCQINADYYFFRILEKIIINWLNNWQFFWIFRQFNKVSLNGISLCHMWLWIVQCVKVCNDSLYFIWKTFKVVNLYFRSFWQQDFKISKIYVWINYCQTCVPTTIVGLKSKNYQFWIWY